MQKLRCLFLTVLLLSACSPTVDEINKDEVVPTVDSVPASSAPQTEPSPAPQVYPGRTIDQVFSPSEWHDFQEAEYKERTYRVPIERYEVEITRLRPTFLMKGSRPVLRFPVYPATGYWSSIVGKSRLLGPESTQVYVVASGPGGVCCTNYWIVDITEKPRIIYRSQEFGSFRDPMEVFDADDDGIFELVQFDSCMRYFRDDCGSCSPEPRVYYKYNRRSEKYLPARGIIQDFVKEQHATSDKWIAEKYQEWSETRDLTLQVDLRRSVIAHVADLLHVDDERKAWATFRKYSGVVDSEDRRELKRRLADCKFYKALNLYK